MDEALNQMYPNQEIHVTQIPLDTISKIKLVQSQKPSRHRPMSYVNSYTSEQDEYLRENFKHQTHKQIADAIGRTPDSVKARLKQLDLYKLKPQYAHKKGVLRKG